MATLAKALLRAHPDRCLWASNWPHPNTQLLPDSADMLALLGQWVPNEATRLPVYDSEMIPNSIIYPI